VNSGNSSPSYGFCDNIKKSVRAFVFLGTPHKGSRITMIGNFVSMLGYWQGSSTNLLESMKTGSGSNAALHDRFLKIIADRDMTKNILCAFETVKESVLGRLSVMQVSYCGQIRNERGIRLRCLMTGRHEGIRINRTTCRKNGNRY